MKHYLSQDTTYLKTQEEGKQSRAGKYWSKKKKPMWKIVGGQNEGKIQFLATNLELTEIKELVDNGIKTVCHMFNFQQSHGKYEKRSTKAFRDENHNRLMEKYNEWYLTSDFYIREKINKL